MPAFKNLNNDSGLKELNDYLATRSYIQGFSVSGEDFAVYRQLPHNVDGDKFPHVLRFYKHIRAQPEHVVASAAGESKSATPKSKPASTPQQKTQTPKQKPSSPKQSPKAKPSSPKAASPKAASPKAEAPKEEAVDDFDLFGEDDGEAKKRLEELQKAKADDKNKKVKEKPVAKSSLVLDVKPEGSETDLAEMEAFVRKIEKEGLHWGAAQLVPVAYGIKKLRIMCTVVDDLVSVDDLQEEIEAYEGVQSTDIYAFNKI